MRSRTRTAVVIAATAVGSAVLGAAAVGGVAVAATGISADDVAAAGEAFGDDDLARPGTVPVDESALPEDDAAEEQALALLASVDQAAAGAAAVAAVGGGEVLGAELGDEDGYVVWEVEVRGADAAVHEVTVDAGDAGVLATEVDDDADDDADGRDDD